MVDPNESEEPADSAGSSDLNAREQKNGRMQIHIWQLLCLMFVVAIFFALIRWLGGFTVLAMAIVLVVAGAFGMPILIIILAIGFSHEVNRQLDVRSNRAVAICMTIWLVCVLIILLFLSMVILSAFG